ncbi:PREDICTED: putative F-box/LRR-repeat protein At4g15060 [Ipomoea nil]|uniref:putative F-box/LRR-repeat protein At4g15060 n=1 Tax=Ipomoea nil TaxID=35883 RepID=UPI000900C53F|nr:PREDICTED: putative F-box/LRR-repeat protein At4g15060 [Ipomoea nil]
MNETGTFEEEELDYFSRLPESVIHHILWIIPFKDAVRCSVLSKTWNRIWCNYPNIALAFCADTLSPLRPLRLFIEHVEGIMEQCLFRKACIQKFQLRITIATVTNMEELAPNVDRWLAAAIERNVSELVLEVSCFPWSDHAYSIPERVFVANSLKVLEVFRCRVEDRFTRCIGLSNLQRLKFRWCQVVGENVLNKILSGCPALEVLEVFAYGSLISVSRNPRLKYVWIEGGTELKRIEIFFTPSLEAFDCRLGKGNPCAIDLDTCTALKHLFLKQAHHFPIHNLLSKLVCIESLDLYECEAVDQIKISSPCLKRLALFYFSSCFPGAIIDLPNLLDLHLNASGECNPDFQFSSWNVPKVEKFHISFSAKSFWSFCRAGLEEFLMQLHNYESLKLFIVGSCHGNGRVINMILHEKLLAVPFPSLGEFLIEALPNSAFISSMREEYLSRSELYIGKFPIRLSLIFSSRQSIELLYKKLIKDCPQWRFELVSTQEIEHEMDSAWKSFINTHSTGYHTATIIIHQFYHRPLLTWRGQPLNKWS